MPRERNGRRGLVLLGATGSVGRQTLEVAARHAARVRVVGLAAGHRTAELAAQALEFRPEVVALGDAQAAAEFARRTAGHWSGEILSGPDGLESLARWDGGEIVVNAMVGIAGLGPTLAALEAGRRLGLANKESLVAAGALVCRARERGGAEIIPIDSEHSALFQCLQGRAPEEIETLVLTASGGPLREWPAAEIARVTPEAALRHPTWSMGPRITVDSATLFNKGMEVIEAGWLFGLPLERVRVLVHPESVVHGLVALRDGGLIAHLAPPDMRLPIQYALSYPERWAAPAARCDPAAWSALRFAEPDLERFPCLRIAREAGLLGGTAPAVCNAADEILVSAFLAGAISLPAIAQGIERTLRRHAVAPDPSLEQIRAADQWARQEAEAFVDELRIRR